MVARLNRIGQRLVREWAGLPAAMRLGLLIFAAGGLLDIAYHAAPLAWLPTLDSYLGHHGSLAHLVTLAGMVVTMLGVLLGSGRSRQKMPGT